MSPISRKLLSAAPRLSVEGTWADVKGSGAFKVEPRRLAVDLPPSQTWPYHRGNLVTLSLDHLGGTWEFRGHVLYKRRNRMVVLEAPQT